VTQIGQKALPDRLTIERQRTENDRMANKTGADHSWVIMCQSLLLRWVPTAYSNSSNPLNFFTLLFALRGYAPPQ
jgi:hypothetical protein